MNQAKSFNVREIKAAFAYVLSRRHGKRDKAILALSFYAGLRAGEIASLTVGCVRDGDSNIKSEIVLHPSQTKGKHARKVFISDRLKRELAAYLALVPDADTTRSLFVTQKGNAFTPNVMCHLFRSIYNDMGMEGASSHSGRRTFITNLAAKGVGVRVLAALAGHQSISTTQRYIDVNDQQLRAAVELF